MARGWAYYFLSIFIGAFINEFTRRAGVSSELRKIVGVKSETIMAEFNLSKILHASVIVSDLEKSLQFYCDLLGLHIDPIRPDLGYPGAWLIIADQQIHLLQLPNPDPIQDRPIHGGHDRHVAIAVDDIQALKAALLQKGIAFTESKSGRKALFTRDPDGNALEFIQIVN